MLPCSHAENEARFHFSVTNCPGNVLAGLSWCRDQAELVQEAHDIPWCQFSRNFPPTEWEMVMPVTVTCLPVAGIGIGVTIAPVLVPRKVQRC